MNQRVDLVRNSLPSSNELVLETIEEAENGIVFRALTKHLPCCPACSQSRVSYHSHYVKRIRDLPWQGRRVQIHLKTRRFRCRNEECRRKIFAEQPAVGGTKRARADAVVRDRGLKLDMLSLVCRANGS